MAADNGEVKPQDQPMKRGRPSKRYHKSLNSLQLLRFAGKVIDKVTVEEADDKGWPWVKVLEFHLTDGRSLTIRAAMDDFVEMVITGEKENANGTKPVRY